MVEMEKDGFEWAEVKKLHFFKVLVGDFKTCLRIPPQFVKNLMGEKEGEINGSNSMPATIEGPSGRIWHVKIEKKMNELFFTTGWPKFVEDHILHEHEFLVFRYNGNFHFSILIFAVSGCEKEERVRERETPARPLRETQERVIETSATPQDKIKQNSETPLTREKREKSSQRSEMETTIEDRESQEKLKPIKDCEIAVNSEQKKEEINKVDSDCEIITNRDEGDKRDRGADKAKEENYEEIMKLARDCRDLATKKRAKDFDLKSLLSEKRKKSTIAETLLNLKKEIDKDYKNQSGNSSPVSNITTNKDGSNNDLPSKQKALKEDDEVEEIKISDTPSHAKSRSAFFYGLVKREKDLKSLKAAMSFQSKYPSLVIPVSQYRSKRSSSLKLPSKFWRKYLPREETIFALRNRSGEEWPVRYLPHSGALAVGWHAFMKGNLLQEDDCCVFELVKRTEFRVHIFRASG